MKAGTWKRGLATTILLVCVVVLPGQAAADHSTFVVAVAPVAESSGTASFTVTLETPAPEGGLTLAYTATDGSSFPGPVRSGEVPIAAGATASAAIAVPVLNDSRDEDDATFTVSVTHGTAAAVSGTATITDDDAEPIASISDVTVIEGNTNTVNAVVTVTLSAPSGKQITVPFSTAPATATEPADYEHNAGNVVFVPGDTSEDIVVKVKGDTLFEPNETFSVVITDPINGGLGEDNRGEITITDDDSSPTPTVSNPSVAEGNAGLTDLTFEVTLPSPRPQVSFNYRTVAGTATGADFIEVGGAQITFPANSSSSPTTLPVTIKVRGEVLDESDESFKLELLNPTTEVVVATATGTITNDDNNTEIMIADASADEPSSGTATLTFTISLSVASGRPVSVSWQTANGTAVAGTDYNAASGTVGFAPGETTKTIEITVVGDTINEENETVLVNLSGSGASLRDAQGQGTIVDKNAPPSLSISDTVGREGGGASFTVELAGNTLRTVTVGFGTSDGTAKEPGDYAARRGTLTFAPGEKSKTLEVTVHDDPLAETAETFSVNLSDVVNGAITKARGTATIEASDQVTTSGTPQSPLRPVVAPTLLPKMVLGPNIVRITRGGLARMFVTCDKRSPLTCRGSVALQTTGKPAVKLGGKVFSVKQGKRQVVAIKLSARALKLLRQRPTLRARVVMLVKTSAKSLRVLPGVITLKAAPKPKPAKKKQNTTARAAP